MEYSSWGMHNKIHRHPRGKKKGKILTSQKHQIYNVIGLKEILVHTNPDTTSLGHTHTHTTGFLQIHTARWVIEGASRNQGYISRVGDYFSLPPIVLRGFTLRGVVSHWCRNGVIKRWHLHERKWFREEQNGRETKVNRMQKFPVYTPCIFNEIQQRCEVYLSKTDKCEQICLHPRLPQRAIYMI